MNDNVILLGNSLNLLNKEQAKSWKKLVVDFEQSVKELESSFAKKWEKIPLVFRMSRFFNILKTDIEQDKENNEAANNNEHAGIKALNAICRGIRDEFNYTGMHKELMKVIGDCQIITTNYDYAIESYFGEKPDSFNEFEGGFDALMSKRKTAIFENLARHHKRVWHMHGEANVPESIIIDNDGYNRGIAEMNVHEGCKGTWLDLFLHSTVHIMGIELQYTEKLLWNALQMRLMTPSDKRKKVHYYHFVYKESVPCLEEILVSFDVDYHPIVVEKSKKGEYDFHKAWRSAIKELKDTMNPKPTPNYPTFHSSHPAYNIVTTTTPTPRNPGRCWMNIGEEKLKEKYAKDDPWIFDCKVRGKRYVFTAKVGDIIEKFENNNVKIMRNGTWRYSFYIDYRGKKLYSKVDRGTKLLDLQEVTSGEEYRRYMKPMSK